MKKISSILLSLFLVISAMLYASEADIFAASIQVKVLGYNWGYINNLDTNRYTYESHTYTFGDRYAYCLEPSIIDTTQDVYKEVDFRNENFSLLSLNGWMGMREMTDEVKKNAQLAIYYGCGHDASREGEAWQVATQMALWHYVIDDGPYTPYGADMNLVQAIIHDVENFKKPIGLRLMDGANVVTDLQNVDDKKTYTLAADVNLAEYDLAVSGAILNGNQIRFPQGASTFQIKASLKGNTNNPVLLLPSIEAQKMIVVGGHPEKSETLVGKVKHDPSFIRKVDLQGNPIRDAQLVIWEDKDKNGIRECAKGECLVDWKTNDYPNGKEINGGLVIGKEYILSEYVVPNGYVKPKDVHFVYNGSNKITLTNFQIKTIKMDNQDQPLANAKFAVYRKDENGNPKGNAIDSWTSDTNEHCIKGLEEDVSYLLCELEAPLGYEKMDNLSFVANHETASVILRATNRPKENEMEIWIKKVDTNGQVIKGAKLALFEEDKEIFTWLSDEGERDIRDYVEEGKSYTIKEIEAPNGYVKTNKVEHFTATRDIKQHIYLENYFIQALKVNEKNEPLSGARLEVYEADANGKKTGSAIASWTTSTSAKVISNLVEDKQYVLHEASAPNGYELAEDILFTANLEQSKTTLVMADDSQSKVTLVKKDTNGLLKQGDATIEGAEFTLTDTTDNKVVGVLKVNAQGKTNVLENITASHSYTLEETKVPAGYKKANVITISGADILAGRNAYNLYTFEVVNEPIHGGVKIIKNNADFGKNENEGNSESLKATFTITNKSKYPVVVEGKTYEKDQVVKTVETDDKGVYTSAKDLLPYGTFEIKETVAPVGYDLISKPVTIEIRKDGEIVALETEFENPIHRGNATIRKNDKDTKANVLQGDATTLKATFEIVNNSKNDVMVNGTRYKKGEVVYTFTTEDYGTFTLPKDLLPLGSYTLREKTQPKEYTKRGTITADFDITKKNETVDLTSKIYNDIIRGGFSFKKNDADLNTNYGQGDATDLTTEIEVVNKSKLPVYVGGKKYDVDAVVLKVTTDKNGAYTSNKDVLPYGTYLLRETKAPVHYTEDGVTETTFTIREDSKIVDVTKAIENEVSRLTIKIQKRDFESKQKTALGVATLQGARFEIINNSKQDVVMGTNRYKKGEVIATITTDKDGIATLENLPYGTYKVKEVVAPTGYLPSGYLESVVVAHGKDKEMIVAYEARPKSEDLSNKAIENQVVRGDFDLRKIHADSQKAIPGVSFKITSVTTGESHIITTDENGYFSSEASYISHTKNTNGGKARDGLWFGAYKKDGSNKYTEMTDPNDELGAMPYDTYKIEELEGPNNKGMTMYSDKFTISRNKVTVGLNNIENIPVKIRTKASSLNNDNVIAAVKDTHITDTVTVKDAHMLVGNKGMLVGTLMDKATGEQVLINGKPVVETKVFDVTKPDFEQQIEFIIDGTQAEGKTLVVFEKLYQVEVDKDGNVTKEKELTEHEDINDEAQTVLVPKVETTATDAESGTHTGKQREEITIKDDVMYTNLRSGKTYTVKGKLYKAVYNAEGDIIGEEAYLDENGNEVTAEKTFKAEAKDGKVTLEFTFKGIVTGETIVAFEELYHNDELFAVHADIHDNPQTTYYPEIKTRAKGVNNTQFIVEGKDATITDTIDYKSVEPNKTYVAEGTLYDKTTGKLTDITAQSTPFTPKKANGSVEVTFNFDATGLGNHIMVVYEKLYQLEEAPKVDEEVKLPKEPVATHVDPNDEAQTIEVEKPETEKYVNKVVHEDLASFRETFTYDIMAYVTHDADAIQIHDRLVELLEFVSEEVSIAIHDSNNHHIHGTVAESGSMLLTETMMEKDGIKDYGLYTVKIEGQSLHVRIKDAKPYRGKWIKVSFDARIKNKYKTIDELRKLGALIKINDDTPILGTTKEHTGITNRASYTIEVDHKARYILDTNIVTVIPPSPKISTTLALADGQKKAEKNGKVQLIDHIQYENLEIGETYRIEGRLVDEYGKTIQIHGTEIKVAIDEFIPKERNGSVDIVFMLDSSALKTNKVIAFEKLYIQGREEVIARHEDLDDEAQTFYFVEKPKIPTKPIVNTNDPSHIQKMAFLLGISIVIFFMALHTKHRYR